MRLALALAVLFVALPAAAQRGRPFAERGDAALVIGLSGVSISDLTPAFGGVGVRYRVTDRTVVGTSVGFGYARQDADDEQQGESTARSLSVALWNENHVGRRGALVSPFLGAGVLVRLADTDAEQTVSSCTDVACPGPAQTARLEASASSFGVGALLGAEVKLARGVTLGGAYTLGVEVARQTNKIERAGPPLPDLDRTSVRVGTGATTLNLSVYF